MEIKNKPQTYLIFYVEGYDKYDKATNTYINVKRIEVIAKNEKEAIRNAKELLPARNYKVWNVYEKLMPQGEIIL